MDVRLLGGLLDFLVGRSGLAHENVVSHRSSEQYRHLSYVANVFAEPLGVELSDILAVKPNEAAVGLVELEEQLQRGGLTTAAFADECYGLLWGNFEAEARSLPVSGWLVHQMVRPTGVGERYILE